MHRIDSRQPKSSNTPSSEFHHFHLIHDSRQKDMGEDTLTEALQQVDRGGMTHGSGLIGRR